MSANESTGRAGHAGQPTAAARQPAAVVLLEAVQGELSAPGLPGGASKPRLAEGKLFAASAVAAVAEELGVDPVELEISRLKSFNAALEAATG